MFTRSDYFIILAVFISFIVSAYLWLNGYKEQGIFTAIWVPSILCFGIYIKLISFTQIYKRRGKSNE